MAYILERKQIFIHKWHDYLVGISPLMFTLWNRTCMALFSSTPPIPLLFKDQLKCICFIKACPDAFSLKLSLLSLSLYFNVNVNQFRPLETQLGHYHHHQPQKEMFFWGWSSLFVSFKCLWHSIQSSLTSHIHSQNVKCSDSYVSCMSTGVGWAGLGSEPSSKSRLHVIQGWFLRWKESARAKDGQGLQLAEALASDPARPRVALSTLEETIFKIEVFCCISELPHLEKSV